MKLKPTLHAQDVSILELHLPCLHSLKQGKRAKKRGIEEEGRGRKVMEEKHKI